METYLTRITDYLLTQSWQIALLVVVIAVASLVLRNKSAHVRYLLWLIVLAKCLVPPLLTVPLAILPQEQPAMLFEVVGTTISEPLELPSEPVKLTPAPIVRERPTKFTIRQWLGAAWIVGTAIFLVFNLLKAVRTNYWLWRKRKALSAELLSDIESLFSAHGVKRFPRTWLVDGISQPFVWGLLRGSIYLPADLLSVKDPKRCRNLLGHELSHVVRFDAAVNFLQVIAQAIFWFHPFVWWANKKIRAEREKSCDEMAIVRLSASPRDYSTAIVETLVAKYESTRPVPSLAVAGPVKNIEERIKTMMKPGKKFYKRPSLIAAISVLLIAFLIVPTALVLTARAETKVPAEREIKPLKSLHEAAVDGDIERVKSLISSSADVDARNGRNRTALHRAAYTGRTEVARFLLEHGADVNAKDNLGRTPLEHAVVASRTKVVELLMEKGANVNARNENGQTPLHIAANSARKHIVEALIDKGADITLKDTDGCTPIYSAIISPKPDRKDVVKLLVAKGKEPSTIHLAAYFGDLDKVRTFVEAGIDVNEKGVCDGTALHFAVAGSQKEIVAFLIAKGADVNVRAADGLTPLHAAVASSGDKGVIELLIAKGADITKGVDIDAHGEMSLMDIWFFTCLERVIGSTEPEELEKDQMTDRLRSLWNSEVTQLLVANGAKISGGIWLSMAAAMDMPDIVELAINQGVDVNAKDAAGSTLLHHASGLGQKKMVELLIAKGADVNAKGKNYQTPLHLAVRKGHRDTVELLLTNGADINAKNKWERIPLDIAIDRGHSEIVELLRKHGAKE